MIIYIILCESDFLADGNPSKDMDAARFYRKCGKFTMSDRNDVSAYFLKRQVEHSEGNAQDLKEMCMMEEIVKSGMHFADRFKRL